MKIENGDGSMRRFQVWILLSLCVFVVLGCIPNDKEYNPYNSDQNQHLQSDSEPRDTSSVTKQDKVSDEPISLPETTSIKIMAVGDIMMHMPQVNAGRTGSGYDFQPFFEEVAPIFAEADLVLGNLETTLAGAERGFSGYPQFNSPDELVDALYHAGFDVITTANNHSLDTGERGVLRTLEQLDRVGLKHTGTFRSGEEREEILVLEKEGIQIAILAYTYGTNGIPVPSGKEYLLNLLYSEQMKQDIIKAKKLGVDIVTICVHFGHEYQVQPIQDQKDLVNQLFEWGADVIFGSHPHVLQPMEVRKWVTDQGEEKEGVVIYSLGNFISNQRTEPRDIGGILSVTVTKTGDNTTLEDVQFIPTYVHIFSKENRTTYRILPLSQELVLRSYPSLTENNYTTLESRYQEMMNHVLPIFEK